MPATVLRAATYARQSRARDDESQGSPQAQEAAGRAFCDAREYEHVRHYQDIGISGWDPKVARPDLDAALAAARAGEIDVLVVYRLDRLTRRGVVEAVRLVGELKSYGCALASVSEPFLDTSTPMGRGIFALFAAMAEQESENIRTRVTATKALLREAGSYSGGPRPFGLDAYRESRDGLSLVMLRPHPAEGPIAADLARRLIGGAGMPKTTVNAEARRLNAEGVPTTTGARWQGSNLTRALRNPALAGIASSRRAGIARDEAGGPRVVWSGPLDVPTWYALQQALDRRSTGDRAEESASLLGTWGPLRCAHCGGPVSGATGAADRVAQYRCSRYIHNQCDNGVVISMRHLDEYLARTVWARAATLDPRDHDDAALLRAVATRFNDAHEDPLTVEARGNALAVIADAEGALAQLHDDRAAGVFRGDSGTEQYRRQAATLNDRMDAARAALDALPRPASGDDVWPLLDALADVRGGAAFDDPAGPWAQWNDEERRDFLSLFLDAVLVTKAKRRGHWDPEERIRLVWTADQSARQPAPF